ncbi:MAG: hypothetical protein AMXMBFR13_00020 [Phycisphaerae bacterium]
MSSIVDAASDSSAWIAEEPNGRHGNPPLPGATVGDTDSHACRTDSRTARTSRPTFKVAHSGAVTASGHATNGAIKTTKAGK